MEDPTAAFQPGGAPPLRGGPPKKSFVGRLAGSVAGHPYAALAVIIVLAVVVIGLYVYYHGLFFLGPYASSRKGRSSAKKDAGAEEKGDPETERLIDSINQR